MKNIIRVTPIIISVTFIFTFQKIHCQDTISGEINYNHEIYISVTDLFLTDITLNFYHIFNNKNSIDCLAGYRFPIKKPSEYPVFRQEDNILWYDQITFRTGYNFNIAEYEEISIYSGISLAMDYYSFKKFNFDHYVDLAGTDYDVDYVISRNKLACGGILKIGVKGYYSRFRLNTFLGWGYFLFYNREIILEKKYTKSGIIIQQDYPEVIKTKEEKSTIHYGFLVGYAF